MESQVRAEALPVTPSTVTPLPLSTRVSEHAARQEPLRKQECQARHDAVRFVEQQLPSCRQASGRLNVSSRTLADWCRRRARGELAPRLRGRPCGEATAEQRIEVETILDETGPRLSLPALQACCSEVSRAVLGYLLAGYRQRFQEEHLQVVETLRWLRDGTVWAIDHSEPPCVIDGSYTRILAIRDLGSGMQLAWTPVVDGTAANALSMLQVLVEQHGPPLVLKSDNGSAFISRSFAEWMAKQRIVQLFSPVRMPRYNGACEAGIGGMKRRTERLAARNDRLLDWTCDDLYAALLWANNDHYPNGLAAGCASSRFAARLRIKDIERDDFEGTVAHNIEKLRPELCTQEHTLTDKLKAVCHRRAVRHALVEHDYLSITRRSIPQPIKSAKCA